MKNVEAYSPDALLDKMIELRQEVYKDGLSIYKKWESAIDNPDFKKSAMNLSFYLALRRRDIREIQEELSTWGLSSLGRLESRTMDTIDAVIASLTKITGRKIENIAYPHKDNFTAGRRQLTKNSTSIFGESPENRNTKIMITMPSESSNDYNYVEDLVDRGMNVARINCAHDNPKTWEGIINNIRKAEKKLNKSCKILMDIAGPKVRISWVFSNSNKSKVFVGDIFLITRKSNIKVDSDINLKIGCNLPEVIDYLKVGDPVLYDDGIIEGVVEDVSSDGALIRVNKIQKSSGIRLKVDKGLNFPHSNIQIDVVTEKDKEDLDFICKHADIIGCSFVKNAHDIKLFLDEIEIRVPEGKLNHIPIMPKIETIQGIHNLPEIIMMTAGKNPLSVMIARGDLAVESGYLRLAELQQEILWVCEAADVPVVWATQVLENMVKTGIPTRAEVTDVAEGGARAECVMLNKGDYILDAIVFLDELLENMEKSQYKKMSRLRALKLAKGVEIEN